MNPAVSASAKVALAPSLSRAARARLALLGLAAATLLFALCSLSTGAMDLGLGEVAQALLFHFRGEAAEPSAATSVVLELRAPRVVLAVLVGAAVGTAGAVMQGLFRNPLADPALLGVSTGAAAAVAVALALAHAVTSFSFLGGPGALTAVAFTGAVGATLVVVVVARRGSRADASLLLLAGVAVNAASASLIGLMVFFANDAALRDLTFWTLGSLGGARWAALGVVGPVLALTVLLSLRLRRPLNALALGEATAQHLGVDVRRTTRMAVALCALGVGAAVSCTGVIAFVGLVVPHLFRLAVGPDHRYVLPGAALLGALLLVAADTVARTVAAPAELPVGVVTSLVGAPFFFGLLRRHAAPRAFH